MKPTRLLHALLSLVFVFSLLGLSQPAAAQTAVDGVVITVRQLTYWQGSFVGYVDDQHFERWPFTLDQSQQFAVTAVPVASDLTPLILLLDANGNELSRATGTLTTSQLAGNYAVQIQPVSGGGFYVLSLRQLEQPEASPTPTSSPTPVPPTPTMPPTEIPPTPTMSPTPVPATPTVSPTPVPPTQTLIPTPVSPSVTTSVNPASINVGERATVSIVLSNIPAGGYSGAEFTCTYDGTLAEASAIAAGGLFGTDPAVALNGPQNGSFIFAIAGSNGNKATTDGIAFTFSLKGLQAGQTAVECKARVSPGDNTLSQIFSNPGSLAVGVPATFTPTSTAVPPTPTETLQPTAVVPTFTATAMPTTSSTLTGQVNASKPVTASLFGPDMSLVTSVLANSNGSFSLTALPGTYTVLASAEGFLKAQGSVTLTAGQTSTMPTVSLLAGDIDGNNVIDQFDAMTIGMAYNTNTPSAADLNNDGVINVLDLELLARNYRASGALDWH